MDDPKMYSTSEIATLFGLKTSYLRKQRQLNQGPKYLKLGKNIFYRQSDVKEWLNSNMFEVMPGCGSNKQ